MPARSRTWRALALGAAALLLSAAAPTSAGRSWQECLDDKWFTDPATDTLKACVAASGPRATRHIGLRLGATVREMKDASTLKPEFGDFTVFFTDDPVDVRWEAVAGRQFVFNDVGGTGQAVLLVDLDIDRKHLDRFSFAWQNRPLSLEEALERAKRLEAWLREAGYAPPSPDPRHKPFAIHDERVTGPVGWAADWNDAERLLNAEAENIEEMLLFILSTPEATVTASLANSRRAARNFLRQGRDPNDPLAGRTIFDRNGGYEWQLDIYVSRPD